ncbi:DNA gyrase/topoisomerase IV subunit A [Trueperella abortisuis]|uniref:DNA topoisomerase (ATP-hydrolyzing) n=1 Tax=Trueperella abortisuis TaxID=445930 RepID=A0ABT9PHV9_9ACTO|nr:DNA topoisomerase IV subunit A [Trueperella abortisuis]MDP9832298.1 DNA gyrase subunit A [Trueperella abortisuis]
MASTEQIVDIDVSQEMRTSFLEYSYSVIYARALPDARDGLKPVQRRILFQMDRMGLRPDRGHVKSSRVIGEVMGRLHPHSDSAIYDAMVRLSQPFTMRLPMVDGHGNFGSLDDGPAAPRYTEVRMAPAALAMTADIDEDVVDMVPNYDNTYLQPEVLPAAIPNLLVNGSSGIAVGMATNMAPHNLGEVIAGARFLLDHPEATLDELMRYIPGPDLPEGGKIVGLDGIRQAYETGRGIFRTRATAHIENVTARKKGIIFTELPYLVGPEKVIDKIKDGVQSKKLQGITGVQNLTDRKHGTRLVVEVKNSFNPEAVLAALYKHTPLEDSFGINNVALVDGQPHTLGLKALLEVFLDHRLTVTRRRTAFRLQKAKDRLHLVEGLLIAILDIDEVIALIRSSDDSATAKDRLMKVFDLTEIQADYILELRLRRLTKFSQIELEQEKNELESEIERLGEILSSDVKLRALVSSELAQTAREFATPRRTVLLESDATKPTSALKVEDDPCWVLLSGDGLIARIVTATEPSHSGPRQRHDAVVARVRTTNLSSIGVITSDGSVTRLNVLDIPAIPETQTAPGLSGGAPVKELLLAGQGSTVVGLVDLDHPPILALATAQGKIKRVNPDYPDRGAIDIIKLADGDAVIGAAPASDDDEIVLVTSNAQLLRFPAADVRPQGRAGQGVAGIRVSDARVIALGVVPANDVAAHGVVTIAGSSGSLPGTAPGSAKVTPLDRYPAKGRGTGGVRTQRFRSGEDQLQLAWVGQLPPRAIGSNGKPVALPDVDERRDGSGTELAAVVTAIG